MKKVINSFSTVYIENSSVNLGDLSLLIPLLELLGLRLGKERKIDDMLGT